MSQKPFIWNNNNSVQWSDPSGYVPEEEEEELETVRPGLAYQVEEYNDVRAQVDRVYPGGSSREMRIAPESEGHIFRNAEGHVPDNALNRSILENTANNKANFLGADKFGKQWYAQTLRSGAQAWTTVVNGKITNGGINKTPQQFNPETGLSAPDRPGQSQPGQPANRTQQTP